MIKSHSQNLQSSLGNAANLAGIELEFKLEGSKARAEFTCNENHQRFRGEVHQGVLALLIDAGMGWLARNGVKVSSVTAKMEFNFYETVKIGEPLVMIVQITKHKRRVLEEIAHIERPDSTLLVEASCLQYIINEYESGKENSAQERVSNPE